MTEPRRSGRSFHVLRSPLAALFIAGLVLRLSGLLFNGMADLYQILLDWGFSVWKHGLVATFGINYGALSYAAFGLAAAGAEHVPRFWWAPYKLLILGFDIALLCVLLRVVPPEQRRLTMVLFWLNPWFILHEAYHGFWEAPHILFGLLGALAVTKGNRAVGWTTAGALMMCSAMFKPQGLLYFMAPVGFYLAVQWIRGFRQALYWWTAGAGGVAILTSLLFLAAGGSAFALVANYRTAFTVMSGVSNGGPGIWRFFSFVYGLATGQSEHVAFVHMPRLLIGAVSAVAALTSLAIFVTFALKFVPNGVTETPLLGLFTNRLSRSGSPVPRPPVDILLLLLALGSLVMSQVGVRAHINHSYTAMVLLVPFAATSTRILWPWVAMAVQLGLSHLLVFALGGAVLLPGRMNLSIYPSASTLVQDVQALPAYGHPDGLLAFQQWVADAVNRLPGETIVSLLSPLVFVVACVLIAALFDEASHGRSRLLRT